jgi:hypothetical protein
MDSALRWRWIGFALLSLGSLLALLAAVAAFQRKPIGIAFGVGALVFMAAGGFANSRIKGPIPPLPWRRILQLGAVVVTMTAALVLVLFLRANVFDTSQPSDGAQPLGDSIDLYDPDIKVVVSAHPLQGTASTVGFGAEIGVLITLTQSSRDSIASLQCSPCVLRKDGEEVARLKDLRPLLAAEGAFLGPLSWAEAMSKKALLTGNVPGSGP